MLELNKVYCMDCLEGLKLLDDESVDSVVTDPPYDLTSQRVYSKVKDIDDIKGDGTLNRNIKENSAYRSLCKGFMGKTWDGTGIAFKVELWKEIFRVLKPGGHILSFGGTRTFHRMACAIEDAGFEIRDCVEWVYGSGFPKSLNISKAIDKLQGNERKIIGYAERFGMEGRKANCGFKNEYVAGQEGTQKAPALKPIEEPISKEAKEFSGWGTALKPSHEPIVLARKPLKEKSVAENVLKYGTGGINIDECRINFINENDLKESVIKNQHADFNSNNGIRVSTKGIYHGDNRPPENYNPVNGRFPANFIHDGSDEVIAEFPNVEDEDLTDKSVQKTLFNDIIEKKLINASRFFKNIESDNEWNVNIVRNNLNPQEKVEGFVLKLVAIEGNQEDNQLKDLIRPFMKEMRQILRENSNQNIELMMFSGQKFVQEAKHTITEKLKENPVNYAEILNLINTTKIIQNLMNIDGFVEVVISNIILKNMVLGEKVSSFKYCAKANKEERNEGCDDLEEKTPMDMSGRKENSAGLLRVRDDGTIGENAFARKTATAKNNHPTVKPLALMEYLVKLITPPNGVVLEPFCGSGTTCVACKKLGFKFIAYEKEKEYIDIAEARLKFVPEKLEKWF